MFGWSLCVAAVLVGAEPEPADAPRLADMERIAARIDQLAAAHWQAEGIEPAGLCDDSTFLRRVSLDLVGRVPTYAEARAFYEDASPDKRARVIRRLMASPEFVRHMAVVLDEMIQGDHAGDEAFIAYLRDALAAGKPWDRLFREMMLGPWETDEQRRSGRFLVDRIKSVDDMARDTSSVFFGVDISCAQCHDHPLVADWKQDHYYGMSSFFNRTYEVKGKKFPGEKDSGEVTFVAHSDGQKRTAGLMFLSGQIVNEQAARSDPKLRERHQRLKAEAEKGQYVPPLFSRREQLVEIALEDRTFFSRAMVNRLWHYLLGYGLVHPVDQMHSGNPPSIDGLLEWLGDDFAAHGYALDRVIAGIALSRTYQLSSRWDSSEDRPHESDFAVAALRPLSPGQYTNSLVLVTGDGAYGQGDADRLAQARQELEDRAADLASPIDPRRDDYQSSVVEALFMSNGAAVQQLLFPAERNLAARLAEIDDTHKLIDQAVWTVLSRPPTADDLEHLAAWIESQSQLDRPRLVRALVWALVTSGEFRFNH